MEEILGYNRKLVKYLAGQSSNTSEVLDILQILTNIEVSAKILKATKVGQSIAKLRKNEHKEIAIKSKGLLKKWKDCIRSPSGTPVEIPSGTPKPSPPEQTPVVDDEVVETHTRNVRPMKEVKQRPNATPPNKKIASPSKAILKPIGLAPLREKCRQKMFEILTPVDRDGNAGKVATQIEDTMALEYAMGRHNENKKEYMNKFRQLSFNLKKNEPLQENLLDYSVSANQLIQMSSEELATAERRQEILKLRDDAFQKSRLDWAEANEEKINKQCGIEGDTGLFTCGRCKSSKTSNTQKQTRSADEPMTVFVACHNCGNRWKC